MNDFPNEPFFTGEYRHRSVTAILLGAIFFLVGLFFLFFEIYVLILRGGQNPGWLGGGLMPPSTWWVFIVVSPIVAFFLLRTGRAMINAALRDAISEIVVDEEGVSIGEHFFDWEDIRWIGGLRSIARRGRSRLAMNVDGVGDVALSNSGDLNHEELDDALEKVSRWVAPDYPDLNVGGSRWWISSLMLPPPPRE